MPLQNRVTPSGEIIAVTGRGTLMGNRGILHNDARQVVRAWQVKRWIACVLEFRGRHRAVMTPHRYTELFFLDEATAFAAGHRPCRECRYADYERFRSIWERCYGGPTNADAMDSRLHCDRLNGKTQRTYRADIAGLPDGVYVGMNGRGWLLFEGSLHAWSDCGYVDRRVRPRAGEIDVITPRAIVDIIAAGYRPDVHPSAQ